MKRILILFLLLPLSAFAWEFEGSIGHTSIEKCQNGCWYQHGFDETMNDNSQAWAFGVTGYIWPSIRFHADYRYLFGINSIAKATPQDSQYNGRNGCVGPCPHMNLFRTDGSMRGVSLTLAPEMQLAPGLKGFIEGGAFIGIPKFNTEAWSEGTNDRPWRGQYSDGPVYAPQLGAGVEFGKGTQILLTAIRVDTPTSDINTTPTWCGWSTTIELRQRF